MATLKTYLINQRTAEAALASEGMSLEDYDPTILGFINDGEQWQCLEDSLDEEVALEWANRAAGYGEIVGLFQWDGGK